ncbi:TlpA family protein disulfide reductase [Methylobacterium sp. NMS14P]|uniref:peroxiredoxin family protein n=1 Tax=Methylobacterium sp. NMS14P TaxID=2894310 RepID=UPI0023581CAA|nr:TlpA disulfide reductase family protein [Methylobacterium sp. NMS14P]WCS25541.1 TlpA family protein disulfide reductase [Methylobacterium sp. NMS14P]
MTILAPELATARWFNTTAPPTLAALRGTVVVLHAFQMLCPGCVAHGTPQAEKLHRMFAGNGAVAVIGLHAVFEHHAAMTEVALEAFIHEYRMTLPIAVDRRGEDGPIPQTMRRYGMRGTPTTIVIDRDGLVREHAFGQVDDLALGILVGSLIAARGKASLRGEPAADRCDESGCRLPEEPRP